MNTDEVNNGGGEVRKEEIGKNEYGKDKQKHSPFIHKK